VPCKGRFCISVAFLGVMSEQSRTDLVMKLYSFTIHVVTQAFLLSHGSCVCKIRNYGELEWEGQQEAGCNKVECGNVMHNTELAQAGVQSVVSCQRC
jgi:hypothetical protein